MATSALCFRNKPAHNFAAFRILLAASCGITLSVDTSEALARSSRARKAELAYSKKPVAERMVGRWSPLDEPKRVLTITKDLHFTDSAISGGNFLKPVDNHPDMYGFSWGNDFKCFATFVPIGRNKLLLNDANPKPDKACITGTVKRVSR